MARNPEELKALGHHTEYSQNYAPEVLETFENQHPDNDYWVRFNCPEFTSRTLPKSVSAMCRM